MDADVDRWIGEYVKECRGDISKSQVRSDLELAFPGLGWIQIAILVIRIWRLLHKR